MESPFAILTAVVAPAILTNACSVLSLGTSNRVARVVDRTRRIYSEMQTLDPASDDYEGRSRQLERLHLRGQLLVRALRLLYASLAGFAASALISVVGAALSLFQLKTPAEILAILGLALGFSSVAGLAVGCSYMVRETSFAVTNLTEESEMMLARARKGEPIAQFLPSKD
jgi:hypothetical protein